ncbi:enoyl-CoA hydratase/isomerase family protein [Actinomycetospora sp. CA-084318]|uniref:enoyl-CoA hydratase/isomerase family protein n=1 Tax=Actinomycetospora sp. CA-084318 TaxID=3239892 RepID=UPI003D977D04
MSVDIRADGAVLTVTLDRPEKLNALRGEDIEALRAGIGELGGARAIVFRGAGGRAFSAGVDVTEFLALDSPDAAREFISALRAMLADVRRAPVTTLAVIDGACVGAAFELALACDLRVVTTRSRLGLPEIRLGIPSVVDASLLQQYVGLGVAKDLVLTGDLLEATDPRLAGLSTRLVDPSDLDRTTEELLARVTGHTPTVLAAQKRLFETWQNTTLEQGIEISVEEFAGVFEAGETRTALHRYGVEHGITPG